MENKILKAPAKKNKISFTQSIEFIWHRERRINALQPPPMVIICFRILCSLARWWVIREYYDDTLLTIMSFDHKLDGFMIVKLWPKSLHSTDPLHLNECGVWAEHSAICIRRRMRKCVRRVFSPQKLCGAFNVPKNGDFLWFPATSFPFGMSAMNAWEFRCSCEYHSSHLW